MEERPIDRDIADHAFKCHNNGEDTALPGTMSRQNETVTQGLFHFFLLEAEDMVNIQKMGAFFFEIKIKDTNRHNFK